MKLNLTLFLMIIGGLLSFYSCKNEQVIVNTDIKIDKDLIIKQLAELASDKYEGRMPFTKGGAMTTAYLKSEMKRIGLKPANGDSYFQEVPMVEITGTPTENMTFTKGKEIKKINKGKDFVFTANKPVEKIDLVNSELVFCGYGVVAPEKNWNDFEGVDMKGKTAVVLVNDPGYGGEDSTFFKGNTMTYYGRWTYKFEEADRQGADAVLIIHETSSAGYPWFVVQGGWSGAELNLESGNKDEHCAGKGWISLDVAKDLFADAGLDLSAQIKAARKPGFKPVPLNTSVSVGLTNEFKRDVSQNVIGIIEGSESPDEYIMYTAHWDHLGIGDVVEGDSIYNGALDNASGTATVLAIAEAFANAKEKPKRSIVFNFVTAEEQGLLGSAYYAENPLFPHAKTVCNINLDGVNSFGPTVDFTITGLGHSEMDDVATDEAKRQDRYVMNESEPEKGYYFRSDHFNFAKKGVPVLYGGGEYEHKEKGIEYMKAQRAKFVSDNYHQPSDEFDAATWNADGMEQDGQLFFNIGYRLANGAEWPKWKEGSEFKAARK